MRACPPSTWAWNPRRKRGESRPIRASDCSNAPPLLPNCCPTPRSTTTCSPSETPIWCRLCWSSAIEPIATDCGTGKKGCIPNGVFSVVLHRGHVMRLMGGHSHSGRGRDRDRGGSFLQRFVESGGRSAAATGYYTWTQINKATNYPHNTI